MRTIKFRAMNDKKEWEYSNNDTPSFWYGLNDGQLDSNTLGQFTGLLDKESKEIWEGDIVKRSDVGVQNPCEVVFDYGCFWLMGWKDCNINYMRLEVLGNIYENPELIKP